MKIIIFAGGIGTRLWPLSRRHSPKQFDQIFNGQSTLQLAVERLAPIFGLPNIYIQTNKNFKTLIRKQIKRLPAKNIILEPARRNLAAAVCLAITELHARKVAGPIALIWADHLMANPKEFTSKLKIGEKLINQNPHRFVFLAEQPRFANNNLGWIKLGKKIGQLNKTPSYKFSGWKYKPNIKQCHTMFKSGKYYWNPGYFITSIEFLIDQYKKLAPKIFKAVTTHKYISAPAHSFDSAIIEKTNLKDAIVLKTNMGWSDPGTLYALKEALQKNKHHNVTQGNVYNLNSKDCLVYNLEDKKLVTTIGLEGTVVVNTKDALIVVPKDEVKQVTDLVKQLEQQKLDKYL